MAAKPKLMNAAWEKVVEMQRTQETFEVTVKSANRSGEQRAQGGPANAAAQRSTAAAQRSTAAGSSTAGSAALCSRRPLMPPAAGAACCLVCAAPALLGRHPHAHPCMLSSMPTHPPPHPCLPALLQA